MLVYAFVSEVSPSAVINGLIINLRYAGLFYVGYILVRDNKLDSTLIKKLIFIPASIVIAFGFLQYTVLPSDILRHVGYGPDTIKPVQFIDNNQNDIRILSTLRGPNPLGAYVMSVMALLFSWLLPKKRVVSLRELIASGVLLAMGMVVLFGSGSRSAWVGGFVALSYIILRRMKRNMLIAFVIVGLIFGAVGWTVVVANKESTFVQKHILHTDPLEGSTIDSDDDRLTTIHSSVEDVVDEPLGIGVGAVGPASFRDDNPVIVENYYLQIAREIGVLGLLGYLAVLFIITWRLVWKTSPVEIGITGVWIGFLVVNLFLPASTDETSTGIVWILAGLGIGGLWSRGTDATIKPKARTYAEQKTKRRTAKA